jgi:alanine transaminase
LSQAGKLGFPDDVVERARFLHGAIGPIGAYSDERGISLIRQDIADFITQRDGAEVKVEHIITTDGRFQQMLVVTFVLVESANDAYFLAAPMNPLYKTAI